jgi:sugar O-acyltransferase (sialic acid O-acetyltransferase NeuD family)
MKKKIAIIGAGGHGKVVGEIALLNKYETINFFDDQFSKIKDYPFNISGNLKSLEINFSFYDDFFISIGNNKDRFNVLNWLVKKKVNITNLIHPKSTISSFSTLGYGICVMANAVVNPGTIIKNGVIVNTSASIDHDCIIEEVSHISPNCSISGGVRIGSLSHVGTGTSIHHGIQIGQNVKIGVGCKVYKNVSDNSIYID